MVGWTARQKVRALPWRHLPCRKGRSPGLRQEVEKAESPPWQGVPGVDAVVRLSNLAGRPGTEQIPEESELKLFEVNSSGLFYRAGALSMLSATAIVLASGAQMATGDSPLPLPAAFDEARGDEDGLPDRFQDQLDVIKARGDDGNWQVDFDNVRYLAADDEAVYYLGHSPDRSEGCLIVVLGADAEQWEATVTCSPMRVIATHGLSLRIDNSMLDIVMNALLVPSGYEFSAAEALGGVVLADGLVRLADTPGWTGETISVGEVDKPEVRVDIFSG